MRNKIPFLHAQILELAYDNIENNEGILDLNLISEKTDYPVDSRILDKAMKSLQTRGYLDYKFVEQNKKKNLLECSVPKSKRDFYQNIIDKTKNKFNFNKTINFENYFEEYQNKTIYKSKLNTAEKEVLISQGIVHKWDKYLEDFPYEFTLRRIKQFCRNKQDNVIDPFSGSGTTVITAKMLGHNAIGIDANPLMAFVSRIKTEWDVDLSEFKKEIFSLNDKLLKGFNDIENVRIKNRFLLKMPKREINQWLSPKLQRQVGYVKDIVEEIHDKKIRDLFRFILAKSAFDASYVSLCPGTTFYPYKKKPPLYELLVKKMNEIYYDMKLLSKNKGYGLVKIINGDSRNIETYTNKKFKLAITSPPYPNDLEYTRQTRLELYLLDFVDSMEDVRKLKKTMIKSSTKLIYKESDSSKYVENNESINEITYNIKKALSDKNWGFDYPRMVKEYFGDMYLNMKSMYNLLEKEGKYVLVVGDQTCKNILIPVGKILADMGKEIGYKKAEIETHRVRRSTTHNFPLPEEDLILTK